MPEWSITETGPTQSSQVTSEQEAWAARQMLELVTESYADLEQMYQEDIGWRKAGAEKTRFTPEGRKQIAALADLAVTGNALIKRGVALRVAYVWGSGVTVTIRDDGSTGQDINAVWQAFWDEPTNRREFTASEAQARYERKLATGGEAFWALPTEPLTGRVKIRRIPASEVTDRVCNPEDAAEVWLYKRVWSAVVVCSDGRRSSEQRTTYYPALGFYPLARPVSYQGDEIRWDAPMRPVTVNCPDEDWRGIGDVLAALPWARMDKEFLEDLAVYMRALTRILGQVTSKSSSARAQARQSLAGTPQAGVGGAPGAPATTPGSWAVTDPNTTLSLVSKSGAQIDADSSKPFATRTAAALEVPLTMLLGDPGMSGARAVAETLDQPTELTFGLRREVHTELFRDVAGYVIDRAIIAPAGPLHGQVTREGDRLIVTLPEGDDRTVEATWPEYDSVPLKEFIDAVSEAEATDVLPPVEVLKLYAKAFKIKDLDEIIDALTDDDGNFIRPSVSAGAVAAALHDRGQDPASVL